MVKIRRYILEADVNSSLSTTSNMWFHTKDYIRVFFHTMKKTKSSSLNKGSRGGHTGQGAMTYEKGSANTVTGNAITSDVAMAMLYNPSREDYGLAKPKDIVSMVDKKGKPLTTKEDVQKQITRISKVRLPRFPAKASENERLKYLTYLQDFEKKYADIMPFIQNYYVINDEAVLEIDEEDIKKYNSFKMFINNIAKKNPENFDIQQWDRIVNSQIISKVPAIDDFDKPFKEDEAGRLVDDPAAEDTGMDDRLVLAQAIMFYEDNFYEGMGQYRDDDFIVHTKTLTSTIPRSNRLKQDTNSLDSAISNNSLEGTKFIKELVEQGLPESLAKTITNNSDTIKSCTFDSPHLIVQFLGSDDMSTRNDKSAINATSNTMNRIYYFAKLEKDATISTNLDGKSVLLFAVGLDNANKFSAGKVYDNMMTPDLLGRIFGTNTPINVDSKTHLGTVMTKEVTTVKYKLKHCVQLPAEILRVLQYGINSVVNIRSLNPKNKEVEDPKTNPIVEGLYRFEVKPNI